MEIPYEVSNPIRDRIFQILKTKKTPQYQLAESINVPREEVSAWKHGESNSFMEMLPAVATALETTVEYLESGDETYRYLGSHAAFEKMENSPKTQHEIADVRLDSVAQKYGMKREQLDELLCDLSVNKLIIMPSQEDHVALVRELENSKLILAFRAADEKTKKIVLAALEIN